MTVLMTPMPHGSAAPAACWAALVDRYAKDGVAAKSRSACAPTARYVPTVAAPMASMTSGPVMLPGDSLARAGLGGIRSGPKKVQKIRPEHVKVDQQHAQHRGKPGGP